MRMTAWRLIAAGAAALALVTTPATAFDGVHAHRGGPNAGGQPAYPENSMEAFQAATAHGADVIELDVRLTADDVPVVMHDATLERTTNCAGALSAVTAAGVAGRCRVDTVGTGRRLRSAPPPGARVPTLRQALAWARAEGARLNIHVKNSPGEAAYDRSPSLMQTILTTIEASGIDKRRVLIQSFYAPNLDAARARGLSTSLLRSRKVSNLRAIAVARENGYPFVSPGWPTARSPDQFARSARRNDRGVIPYGVDTAIAMRRAIDAGVNGFITNDVVVAMRPKQRPDCRRAYVRESRARTGYKRRLRVYKRVRRAVAGKPKARKRAALRHARKLRRRAFSARRAYVRSRSARRVTCAKDR
jgi:glycerophosphoryl diester phosphodiesterase